MRIIRVVALAAVACELLGILFVMLADRAYNWIERRVLG